MAQVYTLPTARYAGAFLIELDPTIDWTEVVAIPGYPIILAADGTAWLDYERLPNGDGYENRLLSWEISDNADASVASLRASLHMRVDNRSLSEGAVESIYNNLSGEFSPAIFGGRRVIVQKALGDPASSDPDDWQPLFWGYMDDPVASSSGVVQIFARDAASRLMVPYTGEPVWIGTEGELVPLDEALQLMLDACFGAAVWRLKSANPDLEWAVPAFEMGEVDNMLQALRDAAQQRGAVVRWWPDPVTKRYQLELFVLQEDKEVPDFSFGPEETTDISAHGSDIVNYRNDFLLRYVSEGELVSIHRPATADEIKAFGLQPLEITEGSTDHIHNVIDAGVMLDSVEAALRVPATIGTRVLHRMVPDIQINSLLSFQPDGRVNQEAVDLYVVGWSKRRAISKQRVEQSTRVDLRHAPVGQLGAWLRSFARKANELTTVQSAFGAVSLRANVDGTVGISFAGNDRARSFGWRLSTDPPPPADADSPEGLTIENTRSGVIEVAEEDFRADPGQVVYLTGYFFPLPEGGGRAGERVLAQTIVPLDALDLLVLKNFRETHLGETVKWEWEPGAAVKEVWIYYSTFEKPVPSDPWPTNEPNREPDVILTVGVDPDSFEYAVPDEGFKTYLQFEPRDDSIPPIAGEIQRATIDALPGALPLIAYVTEVPPSTVGSDLTNVLAVITDPMSRAGRLYAWLNYDSHEEADPNGDPDGYVDVTLTDGHRGVNFSDTWQLTGGGTENLFKDLTIDADLGKRIWLEFVTEDGTSTGQQSFYLRSHARLRDAEFGEMLPDSMKYAWQFAREMRPPAVLEELPEGNPDDVPAAFVGGKLYRWDEEGEKWTAAIPAVDIDGQLLAAQIADNAITTAKIAAGAVEAGKLAAGAVTEEKLGALAVTAEKIAAGAVDTAKIANGAVETAKLATLSVTDAILAAGAVTTTKITDEAITTAKLDAGAVTAEKIAAGTITANEIASLTILAENIAAGAITTAKLDALAVTSEKIAAGAVTTAKLDALAVTAGKIAAGAIEAGHIAAGAVEAEKIAAGAVTTAKLDALAVTAEKIAAGAIVAGKIGAGAVEASHIAANAVTAGKIAVDAVTAGTIAAGAISSSALFVNGVIESAAIATGAIVASKINISHLSSIAQNMGIMLTGGFYNESGNAGLRIDTTTAAPSFWGWVRYLDLAATGSMPLLKSPQVSINADGSMTMGSGFTLDSSGNATFSGALSAASGTFAGTLSAASGTFAGSLSAATGTYLGTLTLDTGINNAIEFVSGGSVFAKVRATSIGGELLEISFTAGGSFNLTSYIAEFTMPVNFSGGIDFSSSIIRTLQLGDPNSGGSGYRMVRVLN